VRTGAPNECGWVKRGSGQRYRSWAVLLTGLALLAASLTPQAALGAYTSSLDNGVIKVGVDTSQMGGAITYLSESTSSKNLINIHDRGREVQQSYYAGPYVDRSVEGQHPIFSPWPWNPITAGDVYDNSASVIASNMTATTMYVKTQPLLWDMSLEQCECVLETWMTLEGRRVRVHNRLTTTRTDNRWGAVVSHNQELPAVYPIADLPRVVSYTGSAPFTGGPTSDIPDDPNAFWSSWTTLESWGACTNADDFGVGVYTPGRTRFYGGWYNPVGDGSGGSQSGNTCYLGPTEAAPLDKTSTFEYDYWLMVGTIDQIRNEAYQLHESIPPPPTGFPAGDSQTWNFDAADDFGGWTPLNTTDSSVSGGALKATSTGSNPQLRSATIEKPAADNKVVVRLRNGTSSTRAELFFTTAADSTWSASKSKQITTLPESNFTTYTFDMSTVPGWTGTITGLRLDPAEATGTFAIDWIRIGNTTESQAPAAPEITDTDPDSPSNGSTTPSVKGSASADTTTVEVFTQSNCQGSSTSGSKSTFEGAGIGVTVAANSTTQLSARARDAAGNTSACSADFAYAHDSQGPAAPDGGEGDGGDTAPPDTAITEKTKDKTKKKTATFAFTSTEPGSTFQCAVDGQTLKVPCTSPYTVKVKKGKHTFQVQAIDQAGNVDGSPATDTWKRKKKRKK
jgi:hypothetical protein